MLREETYIYIYIIAWMINENKEKDEIPLGNATK